MSKTKKTTKKVTKKVEIAPYSNGYFAENLKLCLSPMLKKKDVVKKWTKKVPDFAENMACCLNKDVYIEENLFRQVTKKSYENALKEIHNSATKIIGKNILKENLYDIEIIEELIQIRKWISNLIDLSRIIYHGLHDMCTEEFSEYDDLYDCIIDTEEKFINIYENYEEMEFQEEDFYNKNWDIKCLVQPLISIYQKLLDFGMYIFSLNTNDRLYPYIENFQNFSRELANELYVVAGEFYMSIDNEQIIMSKARDIISKQFEKLENSAKNKIELKNLLYELDKNRSYGSKEDNELLYIYQELKAITNTLIFSSWR